MTLTRRALFRTSLGATTLLALPSLGSAATPYHPSLDSLNQHPVPDWYNDAKLGIFIHWGLYSVPAWAPTQHSAHDFDGRDYLRFNPYAEWYYNSMRIEGSPTQKHHRETYGANFDYYNFAADFNKAIQNWNPGTWADTFADAGARYVVLTTKHHDGFVLWPSKVPNPHLAAGKQRATRDLVGDLNTAVLKKNIRMGVYYSGGFDWTFLPGPFSKPEEAKAGTPQSEEYARYVDAHYRELVARYRPSLLWNDIRYVPKGQALQIFAEYYNSVPGGVIDDRWSPFKHSNFSTPEYKNVPDIQAKKWEECRGLGLSFGYNRAEGDRETITAPNLIHMLVDIVSKNGNLLLDVGPEANGTIPQIQRDRLKTLGTWMKQNGEAIYGTRPWQRAEGKTDGGIDVRFTKKDNAVYAILLGRPKQSDLVLTDFHVPSTKVQLLGSSATLKSKPEGNNLRLTLPLASANEYAPVLKFS